jgi:hypothetical protein
MFAHFTWLGIAEFNLFITIGDSMNSKIKLSCLLLLLSFFYGCSTMPQETETFRVGWRFLPNPSEFLVREGDNIVFEITPKTKMTPETKEENFLLNFGDHEEITLPSLKMDCSSGKCKPFLKEHAYQEDGVYKPRLRYGKKGTEKKADDLKLIIVAKEALTDRQLKKKVQEQMLDKIAAGLKEKLVPQCDPMGENCREPKLAITVSRDANFEYDLGEEGKKDLMLVNAVTEKLVKSGFRVIEKNPQVLIRLAHESVVRIQANTDKKTEEPENERALEKDYLEHLEYSLTTGHESPQKPFVYNIKIEGINDRQRERESKLTETAETQETRNKGATASTTETVTNPAPIEQQENRQQAQGQVTASAKTAESDRLRPFLFAKFSTATNLLVVDRVQDMRIKKIPYYSSHYETYTHRRIASVKVSTRLLNRDGSIIWMENVEGFFKDTKETIMPIAFVSEEENSSPVPNSDKKTCFLWWCF